MVKLRQNSFQKNGFLNVNNSSNNINYSNDVNQLGHRTIQDIKDDMWKAKEKKMNFSPKEPEKVQNRDLQKSFQERMNLLQNSNKWKV